MCHLGGINKNSVLSHRLIDSGFDKAYVLLGQYLLLKKSQELFEKWLKYNFKASTNQAKKFVMIWIDGAASFYNQLSNSN